MGETGKGEKVRENVLYLDLGDGYTSVNTCQN